LNIAFRNFILFFISHLFIGGKIKYTIKIKVILPIKSKALNNSQTIHIPLAALLCMAAY